MVFVVVTNILRPMLCLLKLINTISSKGAIGMLECGTTGVGPKGNARVILLTLISVAAWAAANAPATAGAQYTTINVAGATATMVGPVNASGEAGGIWIDANGLRHGFLRTPDGAISSFDPKSSSSVQNVSLNDAGLAAGTVEDSQQHDHGFIRTPDGTLTSFDVPNSNSGSTFVAHINSSGQVSGRYYAGHHGYGFIRNPDGTFLSYNAPKAQTTVGGSVNDNGAIAGYYYTLYDSLPHAFIRNADGSFATFDAPGAHGTWGGTINAKGVVAGNYTDSRAVDHCYIRAENGTITTFDPPGAALQPAYGSHVTDINSTGAATGFYYDENYTLHGFVRRRDGTFKTFEIHQQPTVVDAITDDGVMSGSYGRYGFLRTP